ncbi:SPOR domain-containing protein [Sphaerospermopsis sp. FACHB-1094]|uniref:SPOR domain-containing protein n=1 Tax=Sphaerospermopsis sp. FACHB-1094 TaxID=2692861 RepID=UPI001684C06C|nr:SPOR domain-containing protein [Sphaerospermopsis sp. FACHB-1094]MBD2132375.1 SPOR domain-containing protein [Sphaerospermopsis sp. FACHB-1094]
MSQNPTIDSGTSSAKTSGLQPALAAALGSLEVQLDQELTRYRRARNGVRQTKKVSVENYIPQPSQELNTITETLVTTQPSTSEFKNNSIFLENSVSDVEKQEQINHLPLSSAEQSTKIQTPPPPPESKPISSIVPTKPKAEGETPVAANHTPKHPDDYLESSEALLRSLQEEQPPTNKSSNSNDSLLSPLGIGSMLLLLASLTLGYVVFNPRTLPQLHLSQLFNRISSKNSENTYVSESNPSPIAQPEITPIPKYPNLAAREFPQVRDPNDVIGLTPKVKPTPTATPQPIVIETPISPVVPLTSVPNVSAIPKPKETLPGLNTEIKPSADGYYYIVADNQGNNALASARQVVPDAYLSDGQKYIYLGALKTEEEAKQRLQQLQAKGIKARVRKP